MLYRTKPRSYVVTPTRRPICKPLIRRNFNSFAVSTLKNSACKKAILKVLGQMLQKEISSLCSTKSKSVLAQKPKDLFTDFHGIVSCLMREMGTKAPILLVLLRTTLKTRWARKNTDIVVAMIISIMCKHRKASVCQFQRILSLVLYTGHSSKQV